MTWVFVIPVFEAPDEPQHWMNARYMHDRLRPPPYNIIYSEGGQAPLYYALMAPFARKTAVPPLDSSCPSRIYHECSADVHRYWPIRMVRILTALLSVLTVLFAYLAGREATGNAWTGLLAGGLVAFLPSFTFRGTNVSNDALVALTAAATTYGIVRLLRRGFTWRVAWLTAFAAALAFLAKVNGLVVGAVLAAVLLLIPAPWWARGERLLAVIGAFLISVPWLLYNQVTYNDPLTLHTMETVLPVLVSHKTLRSAYFLGEFRVLVWRSFIGLFGWMNIPLPRGFYWAFGWAAAVAAAGLAWRLMRVARGKLAAGEGRKELAIIVALAAIMVLAIVQLVQLNLTYTQPQGRLLFPALAAIMVLVAMGLEGLPFWSPRFSAGLLVLLAAVNVVVLMKVIVPAYWLPSMDPHKDASLDLIVPDTVMHGVAGPLLPGTTYAQTFTPKQNYLSMVDFLIATYNRRLSRGVLKMHLRASPAQKQDLATVAVPASEIRDCTYVRFEFPTIYNSAQHTYYAVLETENLAPGEYLTVFLSPKDVYSGGSFWINGIAREQQDTSFRTFYDRGAGCQACKDAVPEEKVFLTR